MREILFRGKRIDNGEWIYGDLINAGFSHVDGSPVVFIQNDVDEYEVVSETVGQLTGLTDKNGKKIFEGDIVENGGYSEHCIVEYYQGQWIGRYKPFTKYFNFDESLSITESLKKVSYIGLGFYAVERNSLKIIGNIHDNPELLGDTP